MGQQSMGVGMSGENDFKPGTGIQCALHEERIRTFTDALNRIEVNHGAQLAAIQSQTQATNGRVRSLERWKIALSAAMAGLIAGTLGDGEILRKIVAAIAGS
jgi:uncharacterized protein YPO0396